MKSPNRTPEYLWTKRPGNRRPKLGAALAGAVLSLGLACTAYAAAAVDPTLPVITFHQGLSVLTPKDPAADRRLVKRLTARTFDMDAMAKAVLGDKAARSTPAQRARLGDVFVKLIAAQIEKDPSVGPGSTMSVVKVTPLRTGDTWLVATKATRGKAMSALTWRVQAEPGGPRIVDVLKAGSSLTAVEAAKVQGDLRTRGIDYVIDELDKSAG